MHYKVILTEKERLYAVAEGDRRMDYATRHKKKSPLYDPLRDRRGCVAELAVNKLFGKKWKPVLGTDLYKGDMLFSNGDIAQIRGSKYPAHGVWIEVFEHDPQVKRLHIYALADPERCDVLVMGWYEGSRIEFDFKAGTQSIAGNKLPLGGWKIIVSKLHPLAELPNKPLFQPDPPEPIYVLQDREGDYVSKVLTGKWEAVKLHFEFTKDINEAAQFKESELIGKATLGIQFVSGYAGGRIIDITTEAT